MSVNENKKRQAGAELCQAQFKLGLAKLATLAAIECVRLLFINFTFYFIYSIFILGGEGFH